MRSYVWKENIYEKKSKLFFKTTETVLLASIAFKFFVSILPVGQRSVYIGKISINYASS